ncbi:hypothetical protein FOZ63_028253 [Perkinsus olseni]|uniref:Uncharacterized protein n=1 Tax=Perkinsus olseni TaxID=32597 RepID=A0A7J6SPX6_PEROL|nr:hypothetical protein FOZ62_005347 [Perkinsus olseni]KAF4735019.1 hypothetical protein FOZ63_028253 [Perkinsus olseni]
MPGPWECVQVEFTQGPTCKVNLVVGCANGTTTSKALYLFESYEFTYNVTKDSEKDHDDFMSDVQKECPGIGLLGDDLNTYRTDEDLQFMMVQFKGFPDNMAPRSCAPTD